MSEKQEEEFLLELQDNQLLKNDYELMKSTWKQFDKRPDEKYKDTGRAWKDLHNRIEEDGMLTGTGDTVRLRSRMVLLRIAAAIAILIAVGIPTVYFSVQNAPGSSMVEYYSDEGVLTVDLPDGSQVFLNEGTTLNYKKSFNENRQVNLKGEGFFDVRSNPERPFRVNSGKVVVTVLGTSFNIKESGNTKDVEVFVESGLVDVRLEGSDNFILLEPGQLALAGKSLVAQPMKNDNYLSWKTKNFKFVDTSVDEILEVLKESYHVEIVSDNITLEEKRLTTSYADQSFDDILKTICLALDMDYEKEGKVYILHSN